MSHPKELLKVAAIDAMPATPKIHALNANAVRSAKSLGDATGLTQMGVHLVTLLPGRDSTEYHRHLYEEECVYVLSGRGEAVLDDKAYAIASGDFLGYPKEGVGHSISNTGDGPLMLLVMGTRLGQDVCDYPHQKKRLYINGEREELVDLQHIVAR